MDRVGVYNGGRGPGRGVLEQGRAMSFVWEVPSKNLSSVCTSGVPQLGKLPPYANLKQLARPWLKGIFLLKSCERCGVSGLTHDLANA